MIITNLIGGLGNQMFQYAVGRAISTKVGQALKLDVTSYVNYHLHQGFELSRIFSGPMDVATSEDIKSVISWRATPILRRLLLRQGLSFFRGKQFVVEPFFQYWAGILQVPSKVFLTGYWQSERYFTEFEDQIRQDFGFKMPLDTKSSEIAKEILAGVSVSLHVRRGDYVSNPQTAAFHGLCTPLYYANAIDYISARLGSMHLYVFSDDIEWVRANLPLGAYSCTFVSHNTGANSWRDMLLMSLCRHHVIANSSFSWWGAWLNPSKEKIVIAPRRWFLKDVDTQDLIPQEWIQL